MAAKESEVLNCSFLAVSKTNLSYTLRSYMPAEAILKANVRFYFLFFEKCARENSVHRYQLSVFSRFFRKAIESFHKSNCNYMTAVIFSFKPIMIIDLPLLLSAHQYANF